uniref:NCK associated protein 5 n=1 Tax=Salmo trutta TaxID=8032 RepID=A0A673YHS0_SALTR
EKRLREVTDESELGRAQMVSLQQHFSRMEETVRTLLQNQGVLEQTAMDTVDIMKAYKVTPHCSALLQNGLSFLLFIKPNRKGLCRRNSSLNVFYFAVQEENSALAMENESQREQYEHCLDEVANQVVQALLTQKDLREECLKLRTRVFDLEQQNRTMSVLFQQRVRPASDLLLQKLHSRIMDLSASDLLLEPERSKSFLLSRNTDSPPHRSLTVQAPVYPRSSCSSSELSLSSACSEYSSGSYTWNEGRSCSSCQMRTLDSGIGTFPLPDSVTRINGRHIPRSESSPDRMMASVHSPTDPDQDLLSASAAHSPSHVKVPSLSETHPHAPPTSALGHSLSDSTVTGRGCGQEALSLLPRPINSGKTGGSPHINIPVTSPFYTLLPNDIDHKPPSACSFTAAAQQHDSGWEGGREGSYGLREVTLTMYLYGDE